MQPPTPPTLDDLAAALAPSVRWPLDRVRVTPQVWAYATSPMDSAASGSGVVVSSQAIDDTPASQTARALELSEDTATALDVSWQDGATMWSVCPFDFAADIG